MQTNKVLTSISEAVANKVSVIHLNHEAGNIQNGTSGHDITLSTLLYLIETAETSIDMIMGYVVLFPSLLEVSRSVS